MHPSFLGGRGKSKRLEGGGVLKLLVFNHHRQIAGRVVAAEVKQCRRLGQLSGTCEETEGKAAPPGTVVMRT